MKAGADALPPRLERWARAHVGPDATVRSVTRLPGHSGITFAFDVHTRGALERLVLRIPPEGVRRSGINDVLRQVPVLQLMEQERVPVPRVRWWDADERWFGVPYVIVDRVPGATPGDVFEGPGDVDDAEPLFRQALQALARVHAVAWCERLAGWDAPQPLAAQVERYLPLLERSPEPAWTARGAELAAGLAASAPADPEPGVVHNDFYSNNWMFERGTLTAVLDWEGAFVGAPLLDVGWVCMMYDRASWSPAHAVRIRWCPPAEVILEAYAEASGIRLTGLDWYRAFAGYRLCSLTAYYLDLHRRGRRPDATWENLGESVEFLLRRAAEMLGR